MKTTRRTGDSVGGEGVPPRLLSPLSCCWDVAVVVVAGVCVGDAAAAIEDVHAH